ncbi:hypothetical protein FcAc13_05220 [Frischella sp. Ac13]|uniref:30S ribosomal protein S20 n=1 Tax=Frischella japonica TaxID=2741544 RepID=A0ABR7QWW1_9GAMM|nr:hypothetical protein [Frischella japonica]MBC9130708.1 hypothetical protein [Frischella japonica]
MATEAQKRAVAKRRMKLESLRFDFNTQKSSDIEALNKFNQLSEKFNSKKEALIYLINLSNK